MRCTGAFEPCASCTMRIICASTVSLPTFSALITKAPFWFIVPASTLSFNFFSTGMGSPLIILSSIKVSPSTISPSTGTRSPGRTLTLSPFFNSEIRISSSLPSRRIRAVFGCNPINLRIAIEVFPFAFSSISFPTSTKAIITVAAS